jgi:hypothetical protein
VRVLAIAALVVIGCSDPTLTVEVHIPDAYRASVARVTLVDYELAGLSCDAIAFGDEPAQTLEGALTTKVETRPGDAAALAGVSRTERKALVARGLDASGNLVVAGCAVADVIDGDAVLAIDTEPAAIVTVDAHRADTSFDSAPISVRVLDALGAPLPDRWITSRVFGPGGKPGGGTGAPGCPLAGVDACVRSNGNGNASWTPPAPTHPGPEVVEVHAEWARAQPPLVAGFVAPLSTFFVLHLGGAAQPASCVAYRAAAGVRLACLATTLAGNLEVQHLGWNGSAMARLPGSPAVPGAQVLIALPDGVTDRPIAITTGGDWIDAVSGQTFAHVTPPGSATIDSAMVVPACGKSAFVAIGFSNGSVGSYDPTGALLTNFASSSDRVFELGGAGCISDVGAPTTQYRAVVMTDTSASTLGATFAYVECPGPKTCRPAWVGLGGIGFVAGETGERRLAIGQIDLSGVIVNEWLLDPSAKDPDELVAPLAHDAVSVPEDILGGDFDGDGHPDRAWLILGASGTNPSGRLQIVLGVTTPSGLTITGVSPDLRPRPSAVVVGRFDDDGTDDLALYSPQGVTVVLTGKLAVAP